MVEVIQVKGRVKIKGGFVVICLAKSIAKCIALIFCDEMKTVIYCCLSLVLKKPLICGYLLLFGFIVEEAIDLVGVLEREGECEDVKLPRLLRCRGNDTGDTVEVRVG
jgi:hypothetical protein